MINEIRELQKINEELERRAGRSHLKDFISYTFPDYKHSWHNETINDKLTDWALGRIPYLIIETAPRHGKSESASRRLPAFLLGNNPNAQILAASYSADLANRMNIDVQRIIDNPLYSELFPDTKLSGMGEVLGKYKRTDKFFEVIDNKGSYRSCGIGGGITGMGMDFGIIDDFCKNFDEVRSEVYREKVWQWYLTTFFTRLEKGASILITATRWHKDDLIGRILDSEHGSKWEVVKLKAIKEDKYLDYDSRETGQALWPYKYPIEKLEEIKIAIGSKNFASLYQQSPSVAEGAIFKRKWWKFYDELPPRPDMTIHSWDTDFGKNAATSAGIQSKLYKSGLYLTGLYDESLEFPQLDSQVRLEDSNDPCDACLIEDKASGQSLIQVLNQESTIPTVPIKPTTDKVSRAHSVSPFVEAGNVFLPRKAQWTKRFIDIMSAFPDIKRKDIVDAFTQLINYVRENRSSSSVVVSAHRRKPKLKGY